MKKLDDGMNEAVRKAEQLGHELDVFSTDGSKAAYSSCIRCNRVVGVEVKPGRHATGGFDLFGDVLDHRCKRAKKSSAVVPLTPDGQGRPRVRRSGRDLVDRIGGQQPHPTTKRVDGKQSSPSARNVLQFPGSEKAVPQFSVGIELEVSGKGNLHKKAAAYLKRNLKALPGAVLTDCDPDYLINVVCLTDSLKGYNISYFVAGTSARLKDLLGEFLDEDLNELMSEYLDGMCCVFEHRIKVGPPEGLKKACEDLVGDFDENYLQEFRTIWEEHLKWL